jgi:tetratricopeptide (TPR) repeat protein
MARPGAEGQALPPEIQKLVRKLTEQLRKDPRSKAFIQLAEEYAKLGHLQDAAAVLQEGLQLDPTFVTALVALGKVYVKLDLPSNARETLEEAIKVSPDNLLAHRMLARIYASEQAWDKARKACETVLFAHPTDDEMLGLRVELSLQTGPGHPSPYLPPQHAEFEHQTTDSPESAQDESQLVDQAVTADSSVSHSADTHHRESEEQPLSQRHGRVDQLQKLLGKIRERRAP